MKTQKNKPAKSTTRPMHVRLRKDLVSDASAKAQSMGQTVEEYLLSLIEADLSNASREIVLRVDAAQLNILLLGIEGMFSTTGVSNRGLGALESEIRRVRDRWSKEDDDMVYDVIKMAPVYRQLLDHWEKDPQRIYGVHEFSNHAEVKREAAYALAVCRA